MKFIFAGLLIFSTSFIANANSLLYISNYNKGDVSLYSLNEKNGTINYLNKFHAGKHVRTSFITPDNKNFYSSYNDAIFSWKINQKNGNLIEKNISNTYAVNYFSSDKKSKVLFLYDPEFRIYALPIDNEKNLVDPDFQKNVLLENTQLNFFSVTDFIIDKNNKDVYLSFKSSKPIHYQFINNSLVYDKKEDATIHDFDEEGSAKSVISADSKYLYSLTAKSGNITQYKINETLDKIKDYKSPLFYEYNNPKSKLYQKFYEYKECLYNSCTSNDIKILNNGEYIYKTENFGNKIVVYKVNKNTGGLSLIQSLKTESIPTNFAITESNKWIIVSGEKSDYISIYSIDPNNGYLKLKNRIKIFNEKNLVGQKSISTINL